MRGKTIRFLAWLMVAIDPDLAQSLFDHMATPVVEADKDRLQRVLHEEVNRARLLEEAKQRLQRELDDVKKALRFYADPETYFGISFLADPPTGGFDQDVEWFDANLERVIDPADLDEHRYSSQRPGKRARIALAKGKNV